MNKLAKLVASVVFLSVSSFTVQAGLIVEAGEVTGATDVLIDGELRAFDFVEGSFNNLFAGVVYTFDAFDPAEQISSMFANSAFADTPSAVRGCEDRVVCSVLLPRDIDSSLFEAASVQVSASLPSGSFLFAASRDADSSTEPSFVFAVLRPTAVPDPSTTGLIGLSLLGLGFARKAQNKA